MIGYRENEKTEFRRQNSEFRIQNKKVYAIFIDGGESIRNDL